MRMVSFELGILPVSTPFFSLLLARVPRNCLWAGLLFVLLGSMAQSPRADRVSRKGPATPQPTSRSQGKTFLCPGQGEPDPLARPPARVPLPELTEKESRLRYTLTPPAGRLFRSLPAWLLRPATGYPLFARPTVQVLFCVWQP
jgi:hypothetical protein